MVHLGMGGRNSRSRHVGRGKGLMPGATHVRHHTKSVERPKKRAQYMPKGPSLASLSESKGHLASLSYASGAYAPPSHHIATTVFAPCAGSISTWRRLPDDGPSHSCLVASPPTHIVLHTCTWPRLPTPPHLVGRRVRRQLLLRLAHRLQHQGLALLRAKCHVAA